MQPLYNIPLIPHNLRREETIVQTADALKHLSDVASDIFNRINKRIEDNAAQLATIMKRIEIAHTKVSKLHGTKKATQVFSSSKYPAVDVHRPYKTVFDKQHNVVYSQSKFEFKDIQSKDEPLEALQFYHVKVDNPEKQVVNGLGDVPVDVVGLNDLLLCNTGKNPYMNYTISDPLQASSRLKKEEKVKSSGIGAPPHSLIERATMTKLGSDSYFYSPDLGTVPTIDVPLDLPDLPGIADDLRYTDQVGPGIAPSVTNTPLVPDLPPLILDVSIHDHTPDLPIVPEMTPVAVPELQEVSKMHHDDQITVSASTDIDISISDLNTSSELPVLNDTHASLMEAIRKAGGATSGNKVKTQEPKKQPTDGDLMADLHAKLSLRRKGISGIKNTDPNVSTGSVDSSSTMQKISAMIPPPPSKVDQSDSTNTEDEEWDD